MSKRIIALLLMFAMVLSVVPPLPAFAAEPETTANATTDATEQTRPTDNTGRIQDTTTITATLNPYNKEADTVTPPEDDETQIVLEVENTVDLPWIENLGVGASVDAESQEDVEVSEDENYINVLLIQEHPAWNTSSNIDVLNKLLNEGYIDEYKVTTMTAAADLDFSEFMMIMIPSDQPQNVYDTYANYVSGKINTYVANGGILYFSVCDHGHAAGGLNVDLPGGVKRSHTPNNYNYIADADHPIVTGEYTDGKALTNSLLNGNYCSHECFVESTLPENTHVILRAGTGSSVGAPTLVEYPYGSGYIVASGLTWEFYYDDRGTYAIQSYDDVIVYALNQNRFDDSTLPVTSLQAPYVGSHTVELVWNPPRNANVIGYRIYRDNVLIGDTDQCHFGDFAPEAGTAYEYQIIGYTAGQLDMEPGVISVTTKATPVVGQVFTDHNNYVGGEERTLYAIVNADAALDGGFGSFTVYMDNGAVQSIPLADYTLTADGAVFAWDWDLEDSNAADGIYTVEFCFKDADEETDISSAQITVENTPPAVIEGLMAQGDLYSIHLSWSIAAEYRVDTYRIYRRVSGTDTWSLLAQKSGNRNDTAYTDGNVEAGVNYEYMVVGVSPLGLEGVQCTPVTGALVMDTEIPVVNSLSPVRNTVLCGVASFSASAVDNDTVASITLYYKRGNNGEPVVIGTASGASITARLDTTTVADGQILVYAVATDAAGNVSAGTPVYPYIIDNTAPAAVTDLAFSSSAAVITLSWRYVQDNDFHHFVVEQKQADGSFRVVTTESKTLGVNLTGLLPGTEYTYRVCVVDHVGNVSAYSEEITASTKSDVTAPVITAITPGAGYRRTDFNVNFTVKDDGPISALEIHCSRDGLNWETVHTWFFPQQKSTQSYSYTVRVSEYPQDGSLYIRAVATDAAGNRSEEDNAPYVQYVLDRTAPIIPQNVTAEPRGNANYILWTNDPAGETVSYRVLRSATEDGVYEEIASGLAAISFYDRTARADTLYWYQVQGQDSVGNISMGSTPVSCSWTNSTDDVIPTVLSISPATGSKLGGTATGISVLAQDDRVLNRIVVVFRNETTGNEQTMTLSGNGSYYLSTTATPDLSGCNTGDRITVTAVAYDSNNNSSEPAQSTYTVDKTAPSVDNLKAQLDGSDVRITWNQGSNSDDLNGYYVYRSNGNGWTRIGTRAARADGAYSFTDTVSVSGSYTYKVTAIDLTGNQKEHLSDAISYTMPVEARLIADYVTDRQQQQGVEYLFDATVSYSYDSTIVSYLFDFGDGTTSDNSRPIHAYEALGTYTVTLTVTDAEGNTDTVSMTVEVKERASLGNVEITVVNDSGVCVSGAPVYFDMDSDKPIIKYTDANGRVSFTANAGTYTIGAYMDGYLPVTKQVLLTGSTTRSVELIMVEQPIVAGEFEVKRMTLEEIVAAGIDINDPANQHCVSVTVQLSYGEQNVDMDFVRNNYGQVIFGSNTTVIGDRQFTAMIIPEGNGWSYGGGGGSFGGGASPSDIVIILETPVSASFLKEFFDVKLHILNQATEEFSLVDNVIMLNVPEGMTLMKESQHSFVETREELKGQEEWTLSWIIRGDEEGDYTLSADYSGVLEKFDADVSATFESPNIHVYGTSAIHLVMNVNRSIRYQACYIDFGIKNVTDVDLYLPSVGIMDAVVRSMQSTAEEYRNVYADTQVISSWVENELGFVDYISEDPQVLTSGESLFHRYAIYGVTDDDIVLYLKGITLSNLKNIGLDQIDVYVNDFDLYPDDGANAEQIMENANGVCKNEFEFLTNPDNYLYFRNGYEDENSFFYHAGSTSKDILDMCLTFSFDCITNNSNRKFFRGIVSELMNDEVVSDYATAKLNATYAEATAKVLTTLAGVLKSMNKDAEDIDEVFGQIMQDDGAVAGISMLLQQNGWGQNTKERLIEIVLNTGLADLTYETLWQILDEPQFCLDIDSTFSDKLGDIGDWFDFGAKLANGWADATDAANVLLTLKYAEEETTYFLRTLMKHLEAQGDKGKWMYDEAEAMLEELQSNSEEARSTMIRVMNRSVGQAIAEFGIEKLAGHVAKATGEYMVNTLGIAASTVSNVAVVYKIVCVVYRLADYAFNISDFYERSEQMIAMMTMNSIFQEEMNACSDAEGKVHALKYIIKTNLVGEGVFVDFIKADKGREEKFEETNGFSIAYYQKYMNRAILSARDKLYNTRTEQQDVPAAPESLTFDYLLGRTVETFTGSYEYSLDGGENWTTCGDGPLADYIRISGKNIAQTLYVRLKATEANRAGANAILTLTAAPTHRYATAAGVLGETCIVEGLTPNTAYEVIRSNAAKPENPDWSAAVTAVADANGVLTVGVSGNGEYLLYRMPATASSFAAQTHSILLSRDMLVEIATSAQGAGKVLCNGAEFTSCVLKNGQMLTLTVSYDAATTAFKGWYVDDALYSTKQTLEIEAVKSMKLTAVFETLESCTFTVIAGEGGKVSGGGTFYKGETQTARAYAEKGYTFSHWEDGNGRIVSVSSTRTVRIMENTVLKAVFKALPKSKIYVSVAYQQIPGMEEPVVKVGVAGQSYRVTMDAPLAETSGTICQGETITLTANNTADATFMHWQTEKGIVVSTNATFTAEAAEYTRYVAVYKVSGQTVTFTGMNGQILSTRQYPVSVTADEITLVAAPAMSGYNFRGWKLGNDSTVYAVGRDTQTLRTKIASAVAAGEDVILNAFYEAIPERFTVTVINGSGSGIYNAAHTLTVRAVSAPEGYYFMGWYENGKLISTNESYSFYVTANRALEACYGQTPGDALGVANLESVTSNTSTKKISFTSVCSVPEDCTILKAGVIATSDPTVGESDDFDASNAAYVRYGTTTKHNYKYTWTKGSVTESQTWYVRAYLVYTDANGNTHTVYGETVSATLYGSQD